MIDPFFQSETDGKPDGRVVLYCGDCLQILPTLAAGSVDAVVTDPPYGLMIAYASFVDTPDNVRTLAARWLPEARRVSGCVAFTPGIGADRFYPPPDHIACWIMTAGGYRASWGFGMWQPILCYGKDRYLARGLGARPDTIFTNGTDGNAKPDHPYPKPLAVWTKVLQRFSLNGDCVLDPFMGSGTTGVACVQTGRRFIGIEISRDYCEIARDRIITAMGGTVEGLPKGSDLFAIAKS